MEKSKFLSLNWKDLIKGLVVAILTAIVTGLYTGIESGTFALTWVFFKPVVMTGIGAGLAYIIKNYLTSSNDRLLSPEKKG